MINIPSNTNAVISKDFKLNIYIYIRYFNYFLNLLN